MDAAAAFTQPRADGLLMDRQAHRFDKGPDGARIRALGPVSLDPDRRLATVDGAPLSLTPTEFDLLEHLLARPGRVFTREERLASVWGYAAHAGTRTVDVHVAQVRAKLGPGGV